jgi:hypothetical protein
MDGIFDPKWIVIQGKSVMYLEMLNEGQFSKGET